MVIRSPHDPEVPSSNPGKNNTSYFSIRDPLSLPSSGGGGGDRVLTFGHKRGWVVSTTFSKTLSTQVLTVHVVVLRVFSAKQLVLRTN